MLDMRMPCEPKQRAGAIGPARRKLVGFAGETHCVRDQAQMLGAGSTAATPDVDERVASRDPAHQFCKLHGVALLKMPELTQRNLLQAHALVERWWRGRRSPPDRGKPTPRPDQQRL